MGKSANLPAPYAGQDTKTPSAVLKSPFCETLLNFNTTESGVTLRKGDSKWASKTLNSTGGVTTETFVGFIPYGSATMFMCVDCDGATQHRYYDISTEGGVPSLAYTSVSGISGDVYSTYFNKRVFTFGSTSSTGDYYDGTSWGSWGYTMPASSNPIGGCGYKNRQYFIFRGTSSYGYSEIDAVTGAVTLVPLGGIISEDSNLAIITSISISNENRSVKLLVFVFFSGEVLFYAGAYPNSTSWELVASANISSPLNYNAVVSPYQGDSLVVTATGLISLRDLFLKGSEDGLSLALSDPITPDWTNLVAAIRYSLGTAFLFAANVCWWKRKNKIIVSFPYQLNPVVGIDFGSTYFVYDTLRGGWSVHRSVGFLPSTGSAFRLIGFQDEILFCGNIIANSTNKIMIKKKEGATDFQDVNYDDSTKTSYPFDMVTAPIPFPKTAVYETDGIEPILESDLYTETNWTFISDFGKQTTDDQNISDTMATTVSKPLLDTGIQNITYVQVRASGTTAASKTIGLNLYSYNVWYDSGEEGSR